MSMKKILSLYVTVALLLTAGTIGDVFAASVPQGTRVRITRPGNGVAAGIDSVIKVEVLVTRLFATLDTVIVALRADTLAPNGLTTLTGTAFSADTLGHDGLGGGFVDTLLNANKISGSTGVDTFRFCFTVSNGDTETTGTGIRAQAFVKQSGTSAYAKLNNLSTTVTTDTGTDTVGDGIRIGIDGDRPTAGVAFDSVLVDTSSGKDFKIGDVISLKATVSNAANLKGVELHLMKPAAIEPESSLFRSAFSISELIARGGIVGTTKVVSEGSFGDNVRIVGAGYTVDNAGNLSGSTSAELAYAAGTDGHNISNAVVPGDVHVVRVDGASPSAVIALGGTSYNAAGAVAKLAATAKVVMAGSNSAQRFIADAGTASDYSSSQ